ncbi:MAG: hypothetical protein GX282_05715 [Campylobacteraceae bacterium]|nr:hypothetical protein [Campylobacteraceae bacterium]
MRKILFLFLTTIFLNAESVQLDFGKAVTDGIKQGIDGLAKEVGKNLGIKKRSNEFSNLKIEGVWKIETGNVYTTFLQTASKSWEVDLKKNGEVYLRDDKRAYTWSYKNDTITFNATNTGVLKIKDEIKVLKNIGSGCFDINLNSTKAKMCKLRGGFAKNPNEAIKIEIK